MADDESVEHFTLLCDDPPHEVVLVDCGPRERDLVVAVRQVAGLSLWRSRNLMRKAPVTVLEGLPADRAQDAVAVLQSAGATAEWRPEPARSRRRPASGCPFAGHGVS
ncbi:ribosomal protein L7/L12 [Streptomyces sp. NPDC126499]|uniref:ribosomal protein L7/L12 n=1 Tax=Streptomyces sp. NPDC126499 TaxID=3155314 RepID=UPI0033169CB2